MLVLEAGGTDRRFWVRVPIGYGRTFNDPAVNWMYEAEPEPALGGVRSFWPRGKLLGGSGSINAMVYVRGQPGDFDDWRARGNAGWGWSERAAALRGHRASARAVRWPITDVSAAAHPLCQAYIAAAATLGFGYTPDFNGSQPEGVGIYPITTRHGLRASTATAFLRPALRRAATCGSQLHAHALRIDFEGRRAVGVSIPARWPTPSACAPSKRVILAAGSVNSPQLLQLSGIGPGALLQQPGIAVVHDLPAVGRNLQDHLAVNYVYRARWPTLNDELYPLWGKLRAGVAVRVDAPRPAVDERQPGRRIRAQQPAAAERRTCSCTSIRPATPQRANARAGS